MGKVSPYHRGNVSVIKGVPHWTTKDGRILALNIMDDQHLANTIAFVERSIGPMLMMYEMAARLESVDIWTLDLDTGPSEHTARAWRGLCFLRAEQDKRGVFLTELKAIAQSWDDDK